MNVSYLTPGMSFECNSWGFSSDGQSFVKKQTPATNWGMYMIEFTKAARGFDFETYKEGYGIKKIKISSQYIREDTLWGRAPRDNCKK